MERITLRERQRQAREDAILEAAHELLVEQGYAALNMDDLATRLGASKATLYQHFPSKEELALQVIVRMMRLGEERIRQYDARLPAIVHLEHAMQQGLAQRVGIAPMQTMMPQFMSQHEGYRQQNQRLIAVLSELVELAKQQGDVKPDLPTAVIVRLLMNLYRADFNDLMKQGLYTSEELGKSIVAIVFNGIRVDQSVHGA